MSELGELQEKFASMVPGLINRAIAAGYGVRIGDCFRDPRVHGKIGVKMGYGHAKSMHKLKLAIDLNLVIGGELVTDARGHDTLHEWWRSIGGAAMIPGDSNHYSLEYRGMR